MINMTWMGTFMVNLYKIGNNYVSIVKTGIIWSEKTALTDEKKRVHLASSKEISY